METMAFIAGIAFGIASWWKLVRCMRVNGRSWWWRHLAGVMLGPLAMVGFPVLVGSLVGAQTASGEPLGVSGMVGGLVISLPMLIALAVSWRATAKSLQRQTSTQPKESLHKIQTENRQSVHEAMSSKAWKKNARKAREKAEPAPVPEIKLKPEPALGPVSELAVEPEPVPVPMPVAQHEPASTPVVEPEPSAIKPREQWSAPYPVSLRFTYRDSKGAISTRELNNWRVSDRRLRGFDLDRGAARTFRLDRIVEVAEGHETLEEAKHNPAQEAPELGPDRQRQGSPEIHFSGFDAEMKRNLERTAEAHGFKVRKSVTKNLDFFCRGPRPSQDKLAKATEKPGCSVIDKDGFLWVIATGEVQS